MTDGKVLIFASKRSANEYRAEEFIDDINKVFSGLEYGDVAEGECQIWEYPSGKIFEISPDRKVDAGDYYTTPYTTKGTMWLPKLVEVGKDTEKVQRAYTQLSGLTSKGSPS